MVRPEWQKLAERSRWESGGQRKYALALNSGVDRADARAHCIAALSSFRPRICSRHDVFVWGQAKTLFSPTRGTVVLHNNEGGTNVSKLNLGPRSGVLKSSQPWMCKAANATAALNSTPAVFGPCGGHAVIGRNPMGVGYFHTVFESLGSLAFLLEYARRPDRHGGAVRVLDNMCIPAVGGQNKAPMGGRICPHGPSPGFVRGFFEFLGINATQLQHYPWVRQTAGPPSFLDRSSAGGERRRLPSSTAAPHAPAWWLRRRSGRSRTPVTAASAARRRRPQRHASGRPKGGGASTTCHHLPPPSTSFHQPPPPPATPCHPLPPPSTRRRNLRLLADPLPPLLACPQAARRAARQPVQNGLHPV